MTRFTGDDDWQPRVPLRQLIAKGQPMSKTAKIADIDYTALPKAAEPETGAKAAESDVLHFLSRTLQAHFLDARPQDIVAKLRNLKAALDQQEITLSRWPDSPSKARICTALAEAKVLVTQIADEYAMPAGDHLARRYS